MNGLLMMLLSTRAYALYVSGRNGGYEPAMRRDCDRVGWSHNLGMCNEGIVTLNLGLKA